MSVVSALEAFVSTLPPNSDSLVVLSSGKKGDQADLHAIEGIVVFLKTMLETLDLKIADLARDGQIVQQAKEAATTILNLDPNLEHKQNYYIRQELILKNKDRPNWSKIS